MSTTVLEALQGAQINFENFRQVRQNFLFEIAMEQLKNGIKALENNMKPNSIIQESMLDDVKTE